MISITIGESRKREIGQLSGAEVAARLCLSLRQISNLAAKGLPKHGSGTRGTYYLWPEVLEWFLAYRASLYAPKGSRPDADTLTEAEIRAKNATAALSELKLRRQTGELVAVADVERAQAQANANVRALLLSIPGKLTPQLAATSSKPKVKALLESAILQALDNLTHSADTLKLDDPPSPAQATLPGAEEDGDG